VNKPVPAYSESVDRAVKPLTIGVAREYFGEGLDSEVEASIRAALKVYADQGAKIVDVSHCRTAPTRSPFTIWSRLPRLRAIWPATTACTMATGAKSFANLIDMYSRSRGEGFGKEVQTPHHAGNNLMPCRAAYKDAYYLTALKVRRLIKNDFDQSFANCDVCWGRHRRPPPSRW